MTRDVRLGAMCLLVAAVSASCFSCGPLSSPAPSVSVDPRDPLTPSEVAAAGAVLRAAGFLAKEVRVGALQLDEPPKTPVAVGATTGHRRVSALLYDWESGVATEVVVDLPRREILSTVRFPPGDPPIRFLIGQRVREALGKSRLWVASLQRRGIGNPARIIPVPGIPEGSHLSLEGDERVVGVLALDRDATFPGMLLSGLRARVNLTRGETESVFDPRAVAAPAEGSADALRRAPLSEWRTGRRGGYEVKGRRITWGIWDFRFGYDPRRGLELYDVAVQTAGQRRSVLYRASVSEILTAYGDPEFGSWAPRDLVDYNLGSYMPVSFVAGFSAPGNATFVNAVTHDALGRPVVLQRAVAIYEREVGVLWAHGSRSRPARELVVTSIAQIDNYDYMFNWIFSEDGSLTIGVDLTGVVNYTEVGGKPEADSEYLEDRQLSARLVAPGVNAPIHQHFFCFRLDFDIGGPEHNAVLELNMLNASSLAENANGEWFALRERLLRSEQEARRNLNLATGRRWRIVNTRKRNANGENIGYELVPGENAVPLMALASRSGQKASFASSHIWVTPYQRDELYAAGRYTNAPSQLGPSLPT